MAVITFNIFLCDLCGFAVNLLFARSALPIVTKTSHSHPSLLLIHPLQNHERP